MQAKFALKITSKYVISQETIDEIFAFIKDIHKVKVELLTQHLKYRFGQENSVPISEVITNIKLVDNIAGNAALNFLAHPRFDAPLLH